MTFEQLYSKYLYDFSMKIYAERDPDDEDEVDDEEDEEDDEVLIVQRKSKIK